MKQKHRIYKSALSLFLILMLVFIPMRPTLAAGDGSFCLFVATGSLTIIAPTRISYEPGQTILEALDASGYSFERHGTFIDVIEGFEGLYLICYDNGGYDLEQPAESITALIVSENESVGGEHLALLKDMVQFNEMDNHVQNYDRAMTAYYAGIAALRNGSVGTAAECRENLATAIAEYESILNGERFTVSVSAQQNGAPVAEPILTLTDSYGNKTTVTGTTADVIAGTYTVSVSDGGWNRTEQKAVVDGDISLSFELPFGEWFGEINLLDQPTRSAYPKTQDAASHTLTLRVPDTEGKTAPIINALQGEDIPDGSATKLYGVYIGTNGMDYSETSRPWNSTAASLIALFGPGMEETSFTLEARFDAGAYTQIQSYFVYVERVPTLSALAVIEESTTLPLFFDPLTDSYSVMTTADTVTITAAGFSDDYTVAGTGTFAISGDTTKTVTVSTGERSKSYSIFLEKRSAVDVTLSVPDETTAEVFNSADYKVEPVDGVYHLAPGLEYYYIATKSGCYHSRAPFTAASGLTVSVAAPETANRISDIALYNGSNASTRIRYEFDQAFSAENHMLACTVPDAISLVYAQATAADGYTVTALYLRQTANLSTNGTPYSVEVNKVVGASSVNPLTYCIIAGGYSQTVTLRASQTAGTVTQYQDYTLLLRRSEHLNSVTLKNDDAALTLLDSSGASTRFDRYVTEYSVSLDRGTTELILDARFVNESDGSAACGGYYAMVNGVRYDAITDVALALDQQADTETVTVEVRHADAVSVPTTYTFTVIKTDPVPVTFDVSPAAAQVFLINNTTGKRIYGEGNVFSVVPGQSYTYTVTAYGYVGLQETAYVAPDAPETVTVSLELAEANSTLPDYSAYWGSPRVDAYNNGVVNVPTPTSAETSALYWATKVGEGYSSDACGCPIIVNGDLYTYAGNHIYRIDTVSGAILAEAAMDHSSSFAINTPTYADGMIFIGLANGTVQAFNAATLESLWIYHDVLKGQPNCPIVYHNGYIYTGFWCGESATADFVCLSVTDEDTSAEKEEKLPTWRYASRGGFYWAGAYVADDYLLIGTDDGSVGYTIGYASILSLDPRTGELLDSCRMPSTGDIRSGVTFVPDGSGGGRGYFTSKGGYFYRIDVNADGSFVENSLRGLRLTNYVVDANNPPMSTSTPTIYNGRAYVGVSGTAQFGQYTSHNITVIDLDTWSIAYTARTQGYPQTSGLLTTSYEAETGSVNVYFFDNYTPGKMRMITDKPGQTSATPTTVESYTESGTTVSFDTGYVLFTPYAEQAQYCICSPIVDEYGTLYYKNDSAYMMAVGSTVVSLEITTLPERTKYHAGDVFDPTGMVVTAVYSNGLTRDVTEYVEWSEDALTEMDTQFQIFFPYMMYHDENGEAGTAVPEPIAMLTLTVEKKAIAGDVNGDGEINRADADMLYAVLRNTWPEPLTEEQAAAADVDADGEITATDAARIYAYCRGNTDAIIGLPQD